MTEDARLTRCFHVSGRVQGVFYRASARDEARRLALTGWIRNLDDGRVEVVAAGTGDALRQFAEWLAAGPPAARVDSLTSAASPPITLADFEIR